MLGYTIANDVTARDLQKSDELWLSAKSQDTFTPAGPWIVTGLDDADLPIGIVHNGSELATASTADLGWKVDEILVYLSVLHDPSPRRPGPHGLPGEPLRPFSPATPSRAAWAESANSPTRSRRLDGRIRRLM